MRIKSAPPGSPIQCCGATAEILRHGELGCRVKVLTIPENSGFCLGPQIWSSESVVETPTGELEVGKLTIGELFGTKVPLTLF